MPGDERDKGECIALKKRFLILVMAAMLAIGFGAGAYADSTLEEISAYLNKGLHLKLKGQDWQPKDEDGNTVYPITYKGYTYLPVRAVGEALGVKIGWDGGTNSVLIGEDAVAYDAVINFPKSKYPKTAAHIEAAIAKGVSAICTINREGSDVNREKSLAGIPTKDGYDRDEWPMAMCNEGGAGADVAYIEPADNRGAGSWVGNALEEYPNGTRILFVITDSTPSVGTNKPGPDTAVSYASCKDAKAAGAAPLHRGDPGYSNALDRDGDGVACE